MFIRKDHIICYFYMPTEEKSLLDVTHKINLKLYA